MSETKKGLILYQTVTGNTTKLALRFKEVFEKSGWDCDIFRVDKKMDPSHPPFQFSDYDFVCAGSGVYNHTCGEEIVAVIYGQAFPGIPGQMTEEQKREFQRYRKLHGPSRREPIVRTIPGPRAGIVFVTYGGADLGPIEAEPALATLALMIEHRGIECVGRFACPGKQENRPTPNFWNGDLLHRPSERDLLKAQIFLEEQLELFLIHREHRKMFPKD